MKFLLLSVVLVAGFSAGFATRIVCYYANWSRYGSEPFKVEDIDPTLCTHMVYTFFGLDEKGYIISRDSWNDIGDEWNEGALYRFARLKQKNPSLKLLLGVGGWNEGPLNFMSMVSSPEKRRVFLESCQQFMRMFKLDGIEIDWIYNDAWGGSEKDKQGYSQLVKEMKPVFEKNGQLLSIATVATQLVVKNSYDLATLSKYVDYIHVMTYEYHGSWEKKTGHVAPLYWKDQVNVNATITSYLKDFGAIPEKLNLGIVSYGASFTLKSPGCTNYEADATGPGRLNPMPYRTFCVQDKVGTWTKFKNEVAKVPYAVARDQWVGYEDMTSVTEKVKYAKSKKLGGISFWRLDMDDFRGNCGPKYPLLAAIKKETMV